MKPFNLDEAKSGARLKTSAAYARRYAKGIKAIAVVPVEWEE
jgi:hypothetical protein